MAEPVRWGILGAANFARTQMGRAIHAAEGAELAALATADPAKAAGFSAFAPRLRVHPSYDALLDDPEVDAVYIPLPNHLHVEWTKKALASGKAVLCEKPIAMTAGEIDGLIAARDAAGILASEAYMIVHHPQWQRARDLVADGAIGTLRHVQGVFAYNNPDPANIRNQAATGGGSLPDIGVYTIGSTRFVTGREPLEIVSASLDRENGVEVTARVAARFDGFSASWVTSMRMGAAQEMTFHGEDGWLKLTAPFNPMVYGEARVVLSRGTTETVERFPGASHYVNQVEAFGRAMRDGAPWPWPLEEAQRTQAVIDAIHAAAAS